MNNNFIFVLMEDVPCEFGQTMGVFTDETEARKEAIDLARAINPEYVRLEKWEPNGVYFWAECLNKNFEWQREIDFRYKDGSIAVSTVSSLLPIQVTTNFAGKSVNFEFQLDENCKPFYQEV